jgi:hypothetical protein
VLLRNLISIGRSCPLLRDEVLLQTVKQLRANPSEDSEGRVWLVLRACLKHFPPSDAFENYLECFLLSGINARMDTRSHLAQQCTRHMHQAIFLFGYNKKVTASWDSSLHTMRRWLSPVAPLDGEEASAGTSASISKPLGINVKCELYHGTTDPAFSQGSVEKLLIPSSALRGTRQNWASRFESLGGGGGGRGVTLAEFAAAIFSKTPRMDPLDREVLMFWLSGTLPPGEGIARLRAEVRFSHDLFLPQDSEEEYRMLERRKLLKNLPTLAPRRLTSADARGEALAVFFETVEHCILQDKALLNVLSQDAARDRGGPRKRFTFASSSDEIVCEDEDEGDEGVSLSGDMFRDFVHVGMEHIIEALPRSPRDNVSFTGAD